MDKCIIDLFEKFIHLDLNKSSVKLNFVDELLKLNYNFLNKNQLIRFLDKIKFTLTINDVDCWEWQAYIPSNGYGKFKISTNNESSSHRLSYQLFNNGIDSNLLVLHNCDNSICVNPFHLKQGTYKLNSLERDIKGRANVVSGEDHPASILTEEDAIAILILHKFKRPTLLQLATEFKVAVMTIQDVIQEKSWLTINPYELSQIEIDKILNSYPNLNRQSESHKLSKDNKIELKLIIESGNYSIPQLAQKYSVTEGSIKYYVKKFSN